MRKILLYVNLIAGAVLALSSFVLFPVCEMLKPDGTPMGCYYSGIFITAVGVVIALLTLAVILSRKFMRLYSLCAIIAVSFCLLVPHKIVTLNPCGLCGNPEHACRAVTMPAVSVIVAIIIVCSTALLVFSLVTGRNT